MPRATKRGRVAGVRSVYDLGPHSARGLSQVFTARLVNPFLCSIFSSTGLAFITQRPLSHRTVPLSESRVQTQRGGFGEGGGGPTLGAVTLFDGCKLLSHWISACGRRVDMRDNVWSGCDRRPLETLFVRCNPTTSPRMTLHPLYGPQNKMKQPLNGWIE